MTSSYSDATLSARPALLPRPPDGRGAPLRSAALVVSALLLAAAARPAPLGAQDVGPAGGGFSGETEELGWSGSADFGLTVTSGNSETTSLAVGADATREFARHTLSLSGNYLRTTENGEEVANRGELSASYRYFPNERFYFTARSAGSFNGPAGLDLRLAPGAGVGYVLAEGEDYQLSAEAGANWIRDAFVDGTSASSVYYAVAEAFSLQLSETTALRQELRYNSNAEDVSDYLLHGEATLTTRITGGIGLRVTVIEDFDATPFQGGPAGEAAEKNDLTLITGVSFQW